jgi:hypothetical protein
VYRDAVRTVSCEPVLFRRHSRKKVPAEVNEKIVKGLVKKFPSLREVYHSKCRRSDYVDRTLVDGTRFVLNGDGSGTIIVRKTVHASWYYNDSPPSIDLPTPWKGMTVASYVRLSVRDWSYSEAAYTDRRAITYLTGDLHPAVRYLDLELLPITLEDLVEVCEKRDKRTSDTKGPLEELRAGLLTTFDVGSMESLLRVLGSSVETLSLAWNDSVRPSLLHLSGLVEMIREHCPKLKRFHITLSGLGHDGKVVTEEDLRLCTETYDGPLEEVNLTVHDVSPFQLPGLAIGRILPCLGKQRTLYQVFTRHDSTNSCQKMTGAFIRFLLR